MRLYRTREVQNNPSFSGAVNDTLLVLHLITLTHMVPRCQSEVEEEETPKIETTRNHADRWFDGLTGHHVTLWPVVEVGKEQRALGFSGPGESRVAFNMASTRL